MSAHHDHMEMAMNHSNMSMGHHMHDMGAGHDDQMMHGGHMMHMGNMKRKLIVSLILTIPIILMSPMMGVHLPFMIEGLPYQSWLVMLIGAIILIYGGAPFYQGAVGELSAKKPAMMTLISMGITVAFGYSLYGTVLSTLHPHTMTMSFMWELATLIDIMLIGHLIEMNAVMRAGSAVDALTQLIPDVAHMQMATMVHDVPVETLHTNDLVIVKENERIPLDGQVTVGQPAIDESLLTGETKLVQKQIGDAVVGGALNGQTAFTMSVSHAADEGFVSQVKQMVTKAQNQKSAVENKADRVAGWLFYAALIVAMMTLIIWTALRGINVALPMVITVLIIACPHALGLAVPLVVARLTGIGAKNGLLIQNRTALEQVGKIKYAILDKTGTLTEGVFKVQKLIATADKSEQKVTAIMAALEQGSSHPLASGILKYAQQLEATIPQATNITGIPGAGVSGIIDGVKYALLSRAAVSELQLDGIVKIDGLTMSYLVQNDTQIIAAVAQGDQIKKEALQLIDYLHTQKIVTIMATGDNDSVAHSVGHQLGIDVIAADLKPADKLQMLHEYQKHGGVMFVGDGVNDGPSLAAADLSIAIGSGTDVAVSVADVVLMRSNPIDVIALLKLARQSNRKIVQNLWWGAGYNVIALPLAAGILAPIGITLSPMVGAVVMSFSTIIVAINAMRLRL
ncbi:cadmium-translocating P-type ATPase [Weissella diestrammenae]|uniref:P-type Cu(+) transporter n=2 Tax=Weissella diestrammenae TaxID=1162633 RepID=A0A7G9T7I0_9LACO|nr:cadmium-translocating P-type ATPase [Weissella diestrammenae]QNN76055.1 cadmium-translocating P-type ATPase [Weissella diestrammenae]